MSNLNSTQDFCSWLVTECSSSSEYAGAYFDNNHLLHIATTNLDAINKTISNAMNGISTASESAEYTFDTVEYSYAQLQAAQNTIWSNKAQYGITGIYTLQRKNSVVVESTKDISDTIPELITLTGVSNIYNIIVDNALSTEDTTYLRGGSAISFSSYGCSLSGGIAFSDGTYGFLSSGHNVSVGDTYKYNGVEIGTATTVVCSGNLDISLITRTDTSYVASKLMNDGVTSCSLNGTAIENDSITMFGKSTGSSTGTIIATDYKFGDFTNMIQSDYARASGDSGGAIIASRTSGNTFVGIHRGTYSGYSVATNWGNVKSEYNLNRWSASES
ncbi:MAG: S1 family peptidase [Oscillospiraceae bacterium]|nr:S1 family peptidase [Oscillospiraceae bacterium]